MTLEWLVLMTYIMTSFPSTSAFQSPFYTIFPTHDQGYGYRNYFAKPTSFPTDNDGYGYGNSFAKSIISVDDQGHGFRNYRSKRVFPRDGQGYGYRNYYSKRTIFPVDDQGFGYRNYASKRTIFPVDDQGFGYRNYDAKRTIFPVDDQGFGYRNYDSKRTIFPVDDQGFGYRKYDAKRTIFPVDDQGFGYRNYNSKRTIFPVDDQGFGYRNYDSKRTIFPADDQSYGYSNDYSKSTIIPVDDQGYGYRDYRAKRLSPDSGSVCNLCIMTYDPDYCIRCWWSRSAIVPIYANKRRVEDDSAEDTAYEGRESDSSNNVDAEEGNFGEFEQDEPEKREEKRGNYSAGFLEADKSALSSSEPLYRFQRGSAVCGCCYLSRLSNIQCCEMCQLTTKRSGNPFMASEDFESGIPSERAFMINPACFCCLRNGGDECCSRCLSK